MNDVHQKMGYPEMPSFFKFFSVLIILAIGCKPAPRELTAIQKSVVSDEINDVMAEIETSLRKLDFERILTFYFDSREVTIASDGTLFPDRNAYFSRFRALVKGIRGIESFEWTGKKIYSLSMERALFTGEFREKIIRDGEEPQNLQGAWTILFQKVNGEWKKEGAPNQFP